MLAQWLVLYSVFAALSAAKQGALYVTTKGSPKIHQLSVHGASLGNFVDMRRWRQVEVSLRGMLVAGFGDDLYVCDSNKRLVITCVRFKVVETVTAVHAGLQVFTSFRDAKIRDAQC
jgi:hypothetical protein